MFRCCFAGARFQLTNAWKCFVVVCVALIPLMLVSAGPSHAQQIPGLVLNKSACLDVPPSPTMATLASCPNLSGIPAGSQFSYVISFENVAPSLLTLSFSDLLPAGFTPTSAICVGSVPAVCGTPSLGATITAAIKLGWMEKGYIVITGFFPGNATGNGLNTAGFTWTDPTTNTAVAQPSNTHGIAILPPLPKPYNLAVNKTGSVTSGSFTAGGSITITYTITVTNTGQTDTEDMSSYFKLIDKAFSSPTSPVAYTYSASNWNCTASTGSNCVTVPTGSTTGGISPNSGGQPIQVFTFPSGAGVIKSGGSMTLTFNVTISVDALCIDGNAPNWIKNSAYITFANSTTSFSDITMSDNTSDVQFNVTDTGISQLCPVKPVSGPIKIEKKQLIPASGSIVPWSQSVWYEIAVTNMSNVDTAHNVKVDDIVTMLPGMPLFTVKTLTISCSSCTSVTPTPTGIFNFITYNTGQGVGSVTIGTMAPGATVMFKIEMDFDQKSCGSHNSAQARQTLNTARVSYDIKPTATITWSYTGYSNSVITDHDKVRPCPFFVKKSVDTQVVDYTAYINYTVQFINTSSRPVDVGSLYDAVALDTPNYSLGVKGTYTYTCSVSPSSVPPTNLALASSPTYLPLTIHYQSQPSQGVRLIQNTNPALPVTFGPNSVVTCNFHLRMDGPDKTDPYCMGDGKPKIVNAALMDVSYYYNTNSTQTPDAYASAQTDVPRCYRLVVAKKFSPTVVGPGGQTTVTLSVTNYGDDPVGGVPLQDSLAGTGLTNISALTCNPACSPTFDAANNIVSGVFTSLASGQTGTLTFTATAPTNVPRVVKNTVTSPFNAQNPFSSNPITGWYNHGSVLSASAQLGVFNLATMTVEKKVVYTGNSTPPILPSPGTFTATVQCSYTYQGFTWSGNYTVSLNHPGGTAPPLTASVPNNTGPPNIPQGAVCNFIETATPPPISGFGYNSVGYSPASHQITLGANASANVGKIENCYSRMASNPGMLPHAYGAPCPINNDLSTVIKTCTPATPVSSSPGVYTSTCSIPVPPQATSGLLQLVEAMNAPGGGTVTSFSVSAPTGSPFTCGTANISGGSATVNCSATGPTTAATTLTATLTFSPGSGNVSNCVKLLSVAPAGVSLPPTLLSNYCVSQIPIPPSPKIAKECSMASWNATTNTFNGTCGIPVTSAPSGMLQVNETLSVNMGGTVTSMSITPPSGSPFTCQPATGINTSAATVNCLATGPISSANLIVTYGYVGAHGATNCAKLINGQPWDPPVSEKCVPINFLPPNRVGDPTPPSSSSTIIPVIPIIPGRGTVTTPKQSETQTPSSTSTPTKAPACDLATTISRNNSCVCRYDSMERRNETSCQCRSGMDFRIGSGCVPRQPTCESGQRYSTDRKRCEPQCASNARYDAASNTCVTERPPPPKCDGDTATAKGSACVCRYPNMALQPNGTCTCARGTEFVSGKGCVRPQPRSEPKPEPKPEPKKEAPRSEPKSEPKPKPEPRSEPRKSKENDKSDAKDSKSGRQ